MHNNIMAAGSRDRPPMLATGRYAQWRSRFLRYIDTRPNGDALRKCILKGPYTPTIVTTPVVPATEDSPAVPEQTTVETVMNMTPENRAHFESEKEAIHLILTGIGDEIYSTVDACQTAQEMWEAIERLQQDQEFMWLCVLRVKQVIEIPEMIQEYQEKYVTEILKKFGFTDVKTASTPMETQKLLLKDEDGEEVDVYLYRSMIGSLMYLTSSRPDIMFAVCACARSQVNPKVSHLLGCKKRML
ncbi:hypothetical protein Tco_1175591 [Tanacetum coccineum]